MTALQGSVGFAGPGGVAAEGMCGTSPQLGPAPYAGGATETVPTAKSDMTVSWTVEIRQRCIECLPLSVMAHESCTPASWYSPMPRGSLQTDADAPAHGNFTVSHTAATHSSAATRSLVMPRR